MNKLKVAVKALRDYLGADRRGIALLDEIVEIANDQRKRVAAMEESAVVSDATINQLRQECAVANRELESVKQELHREAAKRSAAEARHGILLAQIESQAETGEATTEPQGDRVLALLKQVRKRFKKLPVLGKSSGGLVVEDFIKAYSYDEFAGLGMTLAACALVNLPLKMRAERPVRLGNLVDDGKATEAEAARFVHWFRDAISTSKVQDEIYMRTLGDVVEAGWPG